LSKGHRILVAAAQNVMGRRLLRGRVDSSEYLRMTELANAGNEPL